VPTNDTTFTLTQLIQTVRERADMVNSQFVTDAEVITYINQGYAELWDILTQAYGNEYYVESFPITTVSNQILYPLPADFYKLIGVDLQVTSAPVSWVTLRKFEFTERNKYWLANQYAYYGITNLRYRVVGSNLWLTPVPTVGQTLQLWYLPQITYLVNGTDTMDGISGWETYVIVDAAIKCLAKEESDTSVLQAEKAALLVRINNAAEDRDASVPSRVTDTQSIESGWPGGGWGGGGFGGSF
jgi:hypothetical protein